MKQTRKISRYFMLVLAGIVASSLFLAACSAQQPEPPPVQEEQKAEEPAKEEAEPTEEPEPAQEEATEEEAAPAAEEDVTVEELGSGETVINYWNGFTGPDGATMVEMVKQFAEENPDVTIKMQIMPWGVYFDKLAAAIVAGSGGPDLFVLWHSIVPEYAKAGHLRPAASEMFEAGMLPEDDFMPQLVEAVNIDGQKWTVPMDNYGVGVYVNLDLLEEAGIDPNKPPQNQEEFLEYARALTWDKNGKHPGEEGFDPDSVDVWGWGVRDWMRLNIQPALYQWNSDVLSRDDPPEILVNSQGSKDAVQFFVDSVYEHHISPIPAGFDDAEAFANNKVAMWPNGSWMYNWFGERPELNVGIWPYPQIGPERGATLMWSHTLAMPSNLDGAELEATQRLIKYISDHSDTWTREAGMPTARLSLREGIKDEVWTLPVFDEQFRAEGVPEFSSDRFTEVMDAVEPEWDAALNQDKTVDEALDDAADRLERILQN